MSPTRRTSRAPVAARRAATSVLLAVVVTTAGLVTACGVDNQSGTATTSETAAPVVAATPQETSTSPADQGQPAPAVPGPAGAVSTSVPRGLRPVRISVPSIGVDASIIDLGIADDGAIEVPARAAQAGWLDTTPAPGQQGPAVLAGHVDSTTGPAVFYLLSTLEVGARVDVTRRNGTTVSFTVDGVRVYPQDRFPSAEVYGPVPGPVLRLITCGGDYVKSQGGYQDNVVVFAS